MSADSQRFARTVLDAFAAAKRGTDTKVGSAGGPSTSTMTKLRAARDHDEPLATPRTPTLEAIEKAAGWAPGSAWRVWEGGDPEPLEEELPPGVQVIGDSGELVEFRVSGAFGVQAVVRGPIKDIDALQAAVSRLIAGMRVDEADVSNVT